MLEYDTLIDILDRRHALAATADGRTLLLECLRFIDWLRSDMTLSAYAQDLRDDFLARCGMIGAHYDRAISEAARIKDDCLASCPELDDRCDPAVSSDVDPGRYRRSSRAIEATLAAAGRDLRDGTHLNDADADRRIGSTIAILGARIREAVGDGDESHPAFRFVAAVADVEDCYQSIAHRLRALRDASAGTSLLYLEALSEAVMAPRPKSERMDEYQKVVAQIELEPALSQHSEVPVLLDKTQAVKAHLRRVHTELRSLVGSSLSHQRLIARFKMRCLLYDRLRLRELVLNDDKSYVSQREQVLVHELAKYLFDNGVWALVRVPFGHQQVDLFSPGAHPILVEAKAHVNAAREEIIRGIAQLHAYMNTLEGGPFHVREAHYVVFRLHGPIYDLPAIIRFGRYASLTHTIDLGDSADSGSRQPKPAPITAEELVAASAAEPTG